jgi:hypothetical protein
MQWSPLTEEKQNNQLENNSNNNKGGVITIGPTDANQRCTAAKDGKLQGGHCEQTNAVEWLH